MEFKEITAGEVRTGDVVRWRYYGGPAAPKFRTMTVRAVKHSGATAYLLGTQGDRIDAGSTELRFRLGTRVAVAR